MEFTTNFAQLVTHFEGSCLIAGVVFGVVADGEFHDQGDAKWIVFRRSLWGNNNTPFGQRTPGRPIGRRGVGRPSDVFGGFSYY
jgi:hypothetical protein